MLREYAEPSFAPGRPLLDAVLELSDRVHSDFSYEPATTDVSTPLAQVMRERRGVCQDFSELDPESGTTLLVPLERLQRVAPGFLA